MEFWPQETKQFVVIYCSFNITKFKDDLRIEQSMNLNDLFEWDKKFKCDYWLLLFFLLFPFYCSRGFIE